MALRELNPGSGASDAVPPLLAGSPHPALAYRQPLQYIGGLGRDNAWIS
jgi:hypothetical protein